MPRTRRTFCAARERRSSARKKHGRAQKKWSRKMVGGADEDEQNLSATANSHSRPTRDNYSEPVETYEQAKTFHFRLSNPNYDALPIEFNSLTMTIVGVAGGLMLIAIICTNIKR